MKVLLRVAGEFQVADCDFGGPLDLAALTKWRRHVRGPRDQADDDALEFAAIARKRWRSYVKLGRTVASIENIRSAVTADSQAEVAMLGIVRSIARGKPRISGFCLFRRTWCNHIILDLLATNPATRGHIEGSGASLVYFVATIADSLGVPFVWGEATAGSASYYQKWFRTEAVDDLFRIEAARYRMFAARYRDRWRESGLPVA